MGMPSGTDRFKVKKMIAKFDIMSKRLSLAIIVAGVLIGTALLAGDRNSIIINWVPMVAIGFIAAVTLGLFQAHSIVISDEKSDCNSLFSGFIFYDATGINLLLAIRQPQF